MSEIKWLDDMEGSLYHASSCPCARHCLNCFEDLDQIIALQVRLIAEGASAPWGTYTAADQLGPRERYCSTYCRNRAKRERAIDRALAAISTAPRKDQA